MSDEIHLFGCPALNGGFCDCGRVFQRSGIIDNSEKENIDTINNPPHYNNGKSECPGCERAIECIDVARHMSFNLGNALKYIWRCDHKGSAIEDLKKAIWYLEDEITNRGLK